MEAPVYVENQGDRLIMKTWLSIFEQDTKRCTRFDQFPSIVQRAFSKKNTQTKKILHDKLEEKRIQLNTAKESLRLAREQNTKLKTRSELLKSELDVLEQQCPQLELLRTDFIAEVKNRYSAFMIAKDFFKSKLNMYYTVKELSTEEAEIMVEFFTSKKTKTQNNSITLNKNGDNFSLTQMKPELPVFDKLAQRLQETKDVPGLLVCVRYLFYNHMKRH